MSEEKEEALRQISEIKNHLVDKQTFFPYNYNATFVWSFIVVVLVAIMVPMYEASVLQGTLVTFVLVTIGFVTEGILTKKVNESYDIEDCTLRQQFIMKGFVLISFYLIVLSAILASHNLYAVMYLSWLFMVSLGYFSVGFVLNIKRFLQMARFNMLAAVTLLAIGFLKDVLVGAEGTFLSVVQLFLILGLAVMPAIIAWQQKSEE